LWAKKDEEEEEEKWISQSFVCDSLASGMFIRANRIITRERERSRIPSLKRLERRSSENKR